MNNNNSSGPLIQIVVAYSKNRVIGRDGILPWDLPSDLAHFKRTTLGCPVIMGRKTFESIGRPLPGRQNIVLSRNFKYMLVDGATTYTTLTQAVGRHLNAQRVCIIGGAEIFNTALILADEIVATEIQADVEGDTYFPALNPATWEEVSREPQPAENGFDFDFVTYRRIGAQR